MGYIYENKAENKVISSLNLAEDSVIVLWNSNCQMQWRSIEYSAWIVAYIQAHDAKLRR